MSEQRSGFKVTPIPRPGESELAWHEWLLLFSIIIAAALFCALAFTATIAHAADPLPSWNDGPA